MIDRHERPGEPFVFRHLRLGKTTINFREKFSAADIYERNGGRKEDWLEGLSFQLKNRSDRQINFILLQLQFPEALVGGARMVHQTHLGRLPRSVEGVESAPKELLALDPGESVTFVLSAEKLDSLKRFLMTQRIQLASLNKVEIRIASIAFNDGAKWEQDYYYKPNSERQNGFERVDRLVPINRKQESAKE